MKVAITGGTGFVGRALTKTLLSAGHQVTLIARSVERAKALGAEAVTFDDLGPTLRTADAVINLAGEPVIARWTAAHKVAIRTSRVDLTRRLVDAMTSGAPPVLVSASAVGYYGPNDDRELAEDAPPGDDYLAELCRDWEAAAVAAERFGTRVARVRVGVVIGKGGGALAQMLLPFKAGVGGRVGSGRQYVSWIHMDDLVAMLIKAATDDRWSGPFNGTAPEPVTNLELTKTLGRILRRPTVFPVPKLALRLLYGDGAHVLLTGQRVVPKRSKELGFAFTFGTLEPAIESVL